MTDQNNEVKTEKKSVYWVDGVTQSEIGWVYFDSELIKAIIEVVGGDDVFLKATDSFYYEGAEGLYTEREEYLATGLVNKEVVIDLFKNHKEEIYKHIAAMYNEYGEDVIADGMEICFGVKEDPNNPIATLIENDEMEAHPEILHAVTLGVCIELIRLVSILLEYGRI